tara:strand:- start:1553 stop:2404 length:852 start_codon:yes stop_codon:yes gene_type:complete
VTESTASARGNLDIDALLHARYGDAAPALTESALRDSATLAGLLHHHTVRHFTDAPVSDQAITAMLAAAQSAASSSNLQLWSVVEIRDAATMRALVDEVGTSTFVADAPVILLFIADWARASAIAAAEGAADEAADYLESTLVAFVDAALAAQNAVVAAESLGLGTCYLGSVRNNPERAAELIGLPDRAMVAFGLAVGYPDPTDTAGIKPRLAPSVVHSRERYCPITDADVAAYDAEIAAYHASQGRPTGWSRAVIRRVKDAAGLNGRDRMRAWLTGRGMPSN